MEIFALLCINGTQSIVENSERLPPESMMKIGQTLNQKGGLVCYAELHPNDGFDGSKYLLSEVLQNKTSETHACVS